MMCTAWLALISGSVFWLRLSEAGCPPGCLCISDIVNCGSLGMDRFPPLLPPTVSVLDLSHNQFTWLAAGTLHGLPRLDVLRMSDNRISLLSPAAFHNASVLRHLDLSSNRLQVVMRHPFQDLLGLEELLLYNNRISLVESNAFMGLKKLQKVYLSLNQLTNFPFFSIRKHSHPELVALDLSSNRMSTLPLDDMVLLPIAVQRGLFIHNNSLTCDCSMYRMFWHWDKEDYEAIRDFKDNYLCQTNEEPPVPIRFLHSPRFFENCTLEKMISLISPKVDVLVYEGDRVRLDCTGALSDLVLSYSWVVPQEDTSIQPIQNRNLRLYKDGVLEIPAVRAADSGIYQCVAMDVARMINESREVNLTVAGQHFTGEPFSTGYTTLLGCAVTVALILIYLYLTPCHCSCCKPSPPLPTDSSPEEGLQTLLSILGAPLVPEQKLKGRASADRHVVFLEPLVQEGNRHLAEAFTAEQLTLWCDKAQLARMKQCDEHV